MTTTKKKTAASALDSARAELAEEHKNEIAALERRFALLAMLPADQSAPFTVGESVAVVDLRDGAVVEPCTEITRIEREDGRDVATLTAGFRVAVKCLRHLP